jgi:curved DNA-binding protein CbpA
MVNLKTNYVEDPYRALNLPHTATEDDMRGSYRQLAKKYHPDTWSAPCFSEAEKRHATQVFQRISAAHALLADKDKKTDYDRNYKLGLYPESSSAGKEEHRAPPSKSSPVRPPRTGAPPPLPRGWTTATDPTSGSLYYCHVSSGKSSWTHPSIDCNNSTNYSTASGSAQSGYGYGNTYDNNSGPHHDTNGGQYGFGGGGWGGTSSGPSGGNDFGGTSFPGKRRFPTRNRGASPPLHQDGYYSSDYDRTILTTGEPDTHRCGAFLALWLCPPIGIVACYHSIMVDRCWKQKEESGRNEPPPKGDDDYIHGSKRHEDLAHGHSKRAGAYACFGNSIGILFWAYMLLFREGSNLEWLREWKLDEWWPDDWDFGE